MSIRSKTTTLGPPESEWRERCLHELFERQVERTPRAIAVECEGEVMTYQDLNCWANQVARYLQRQGIGPEMVVGLSLERDLELFIAFLGVLKAGAAALYLPPDASYPRERLAFMLRDARVALIMVDRQQKVEALPPSEAATVCLQSDWKAIRLESTENLVGVVAPESLAYVIYTSGSTGAPKGVLVEHRGLGSLSEGIIRGMDLRRDDHVLQFFSPSFDAFVFELVISLTHGASLHVVPDAVRRDLPSLAMFLRRAAITVATLTPSVLAALPQKDLPTLKKLIIAGEVCPAELVRRWAAPGRRVFNAYGPTEATICASYSECKADGQPPTIGRALPHIKITIRDEAHLPLPDGVEGEICLGGACLARGYTDPRLSAERFVADPLAPAQTIYLTGDRGRIDQARGGEIVFLGRNDGQVKLRGFRIELSEIEATLAQHTTACAVVVHENSLVACVVLHRDRPASVDELFTHLQEKLPAYMLPKAIVVLGELPRTSSDKVDRQALLAALPDWCQLADDGLFVAARTPVERRLAEISAQTLNRHLLTQLRAPDINMCLSFDQQGGDSLTMGDLLLSIAEAFGVDDVAEEDIVRRSLTELAELIEARMEPEKARG